MTWPPRNKCTDEKRSFAEGEEEEGGEDSARDSLKSAKSEGGWGGPQGVGTLAGEHPIPHVRSQAKLDAGQGLHLTGLALRWPLPALLTDPSGKEEKELELSDLEDFDPLEAQTPECELKVPFQPLDSGLEHVPATPDGSSAHGKEAPDTLQMPLVSGAAATLDEDLERARSCLQSAVAGPEQRPGTEGGPQACDAKLGFAQAGAPAGLEAKPRIWSLAHTATALSQTEFPSCMLKRPGPATPVAAPSPVAVAPSGALDRHQDSPVTSLRNWVDGVFHDPVLRHSTLNQAWATAKGALLDPGPLGRSLGASTNVLAAPLACAFPPAHEAAAAGAARELLPTPKASGKSFCA